MIVDVIVKPSSKWPGLTQERETIVLRVRERAVEGAANAACIAALAKHFGVSPSRVRLVRGVRSRRKRFEIDAR